MTRRENFIKNAKCKRSHRRAMSNSAWCDLNKDCTVLKLQDLCINSNCNCQKHITFSPKQFQMEGAGFENTVKRILRGLQKCGINSSNPE